METLVPHPKLEQENVPNKPIVILKWKSVPAFLALYYEDGEYTIALWDQGRDRILTCSCSNEDEVAIDIESANLTYKYGPFTFGLTKDRAVLFNNAGEQLAVTGVIPANFIADPQPTKCEMVNSHDCRVHGHGPGVEQGLIEIDM